MKLNEYNIMLVFNLNSIFKRDLVIDHKMTKGHGYFANSFNLFFFLLSR